MADSRFSVVGTPLAGLKSVTRKRLGDERGFLSRLFCRDELSAAGFRNPIVQINHTLTRIPGTVRGFHFQFSPFSEDKFVSVLAGEVFDVAIDLRAGSPTFLQWHGERLSQENGKSLFIPKGFAHGFQTLTPNCELVYLHTQAYEPTAEGGLNALDPRLAVVWPLAVSDMSARDRNHPMIQSGFTGITP
ncbi:dTDP-4-dehydrorhamnose 3,5-epimerase family protein [Sphingomonas sanguinis]|jgi:dTDP-4-dehydrorhamnose 3,5-epimerase|uniref:dTDP-4-dehydrorhamnose 3,5-epimerase family protein n=1 Tax=Sphingomonas sp. LC-1 TaxID=3110957 RepID=UPI0021BB8DA9|nr:dTDP-4-dehydrorhamnose 3,5-epimerase family protein [Sphingomonas sp. LC-1]MCT8003872.1 dTDP-4-dehydrorhamnose 3,5-epimerase family protein [Sphingomonas sp. LC-1]